MKISSIAALLLIGTTVMIAENSSGTNGIVIEGTEGASNTYYGLGAGDAGGGNYNSFFGWRAGFSNTGSYNTFSGYLSGNHNITGIQNTFSGMYSGFSNETGHMNSFIGYGSGYANKTGDSNTFGGYESGYSNTTGSDNTFNGNSSGYSNETGRSNIFSGYDSGFSNTEGSGNTFLGSSSGYSNMAGSYNIFLGYQAGYYETVSDRLYIENSNSTTPLIYGEFDNDLVRINGNFETTDTIRSIWAGSNTEGDGLTNLLLLAAHNSETDLGSDAGFALANGNYDAQWNFRTHQNGSAFVATMAGTGGPEFTVKNATGDFKNVELYLGNGAKNVGGVWINASSRALKENIKPLSTKEALIAFSKLQPVTYNYKSDKKEQVVGFIAEDVPELVAIQSRDGLSPMDMVAVLTKVVQVQEKKIAMMEAKDERMAAMEVEMKAKDTAMEAKIAKLELMQKRLTQVESLLTNLALDTSSINKAKVSLNLK